MNSKTINEKGLAIVHSRETWTAYGTNKTALLLIGNVGDAPEMAEEMAEKFRGLLSRPVERSLGKFHVGELRKQVGEFRGVTEKCPNCQGDRENLYDCPDCGGLGLVKLPDVRKGEIGGELVDLNMIAWALSDVGESRPAKVRTISGCKIGRIPRVLLIDGGEWRVYSMIFAKSDV